MSGALYVPGQGLRVPTIAEIMREACTFERYQEHKLWYAIRYDVEAPTDVHPHLSREKWIVKQSWKFEFPVPVNDAGEGTFEPEMKAVNMMRWIRKHIEFLKKAVEEQDHHREMCHKGYRP